MSLITEDDLRLQELMRHITPAIDKQLGEEAAKARNIRDDHMMSRPVVGGKPVLPSLTALTDEEKTNFSLSVAAQYLNQFVFLINQINSECLDGEFDIAAGMADFIWVAYPDLAPYLDSEAPSVVINKRQNDHINFTWSRYTNGEVDDSTMFAPNRRFLITDDKFAELEATRNRRISREYLIFNFVQGAIRGAGDMGWLTVIDARFDTADVQAAEDQTEASEE